MYDDDDADNLRIGIPSFFCEFVDHRSDILQFSVRILQCRCVPEIFFCLIDDRSCEESTPDFPNRFQ